MRASCKLLVAVSGLCCVVLAGLGIKLKGIPHGKGAPPGATAGQVPGDLVGSPANPGHPAPESPDSRHGMPREPASGNPAGPTLAPTPAESSPAVPAEVRISGAVPADGAAARPPSRPDPDTEAAQLFSTPVDLRDPAKRAELVAKLRALEDRKLALVRDKSQRLGIPLDILQPDGRRLHLVDFDGDRPLYEASHNRNAALSTGASLVRSTAPYYASGAGLTVGLWESGGVPRSTHREFGAPSKITVLDGSSVITDHATHVAGTLAALGIDSAALGMAPAAAIFACDSTNASSEMLAHGAAAPGEPGKLAISNHSYGYVLGWNGTTWYGNFTDNGNPTDDFDTWFGRYDSTSAYYDGFLYNLPYYLPFWSAGNDRNDDPPAPGQTWYLRNGTPRTYDPTQHPPGDGTYKSGYDLLGSYQACKNVMTVGAVEDAVTAGVRDVAVGGLTAFSSTGPSDDGRIKPDIVANGALLYSADSASDADYISMSGTSMACPNAAGSAMLLVDYFARCFPGLAMRASTLKALIIHTADDVGAPGPDYQNGWGLMNTERAAALIRSHAASAHSKAIHEDILTNGSTRSFNFGWDGVSPIRATLCWTDPAGSGSTAHDNRSADLVNDLNLTITGPDATVHLPFAMPYVGNWTIAKLSAPAIRAVNAVDTVEQVLIDAPSQPGLYRVTVSHGANLAALNPQHFSLILSGLVAVPGEIAVERPVGSGLTDHVSSVSFGAAPVGASYAPLVFTVKNAGPGDLAGSYFASNTGSHPGDFSVNASGLGPAIAPGSSATFSVAFAPSGLGDRSAVLHLISNDEDESPFEILVSGTGVESASVVVGQPAFSTQAISVSQSTTPGPSGCAVSRDGKLAVCDQAARRVLIWNTIPTTLGCPADVVVGKESFTDSSGAVSAAAVGSCDGVAFAHDGRKLIVSDSGNHRVLIWNSIPSVNGVPADVVIGQPDFVSNASGRSATKLNYPAGLLITPATPTSASKLLVADYGNNRVLIYHAIPATNGAAADIVIGQPTMNSGAPGSGANQLNQPWDMALAPDNRLLIADLGNNRVTIHNTLPTANNAAAQIVIGQSNFGLTSGGTSVTKLLAPNGVDVSPAGKLAVSEYGNHRVLIFDRVPVANGSAADAVCGQPDFNTATAFNGGTHLGSMLKPYPPVYAADGRLLVPGRYMRRIMIFGTPAPEIALELASGFDLPVGAGLSLGSERIASPAQSHSVTIRNLGGAPLTHLELRQAGANPGDFQISTSGLPTSLPPYSQASFSLAFSPQEPGSRSAFIQVASNDADESDFALSLSGTGLWTFAAWANRQGLRGENSASDGIPLLLKYAFNLDGPAASPHPMMPGDTAGFPAIQLQGPGMAPVLRFEFLRRIGGELIYTPMKSPDLSASSWAPLSSTPAVTPVDSVWERVVHEEPVPSSPCFGRVEVRLPE